MILKTYIWLNIVAHIVRTGHVDRAAGTRWHLRGPWSSYWLICARSGYGHPGHSGSLRTIGLASLNGTRICWSTVIRLKTQSLKKIDLCKNYVDYR